MKKHLFKFALTLFVCTLSSNVFADEDSYCFPVQYFTGYSFNNDWSKPKEVDDWLCAINNNLNDALKIEALDDKHDGYAQTPSLGYAGDVKLSFKYAKTSSSTETSVFLKILNGGKFKQSNSSTLEIPKIKHHNNNIQNITTGTYDIIGATIETIIEFSAKKDKYYLIDDVSVTKDGMTLDESINNASWITGNNDKVRTVKTERTLTANIWNTMCLPFDVNKQLLEGALGTDKKIELRTYSIYDVTNKVMNFEVADNATIEAGTPFLIKLNATVKNPTFTGVTIKDVAAKTIESNGVSFVGTYSPVELNTDGTNLFITIVNELAKPTATGNKMPGLRAYITVPSNFDFNDARLFLDDEATAINSIGTKKATNSATLYNLQGQRVKHPRSGLYIKNNKLTIIR